MLPDARVSFVTRLSLDLPPYWKPYLLGVGRVHNLGGVKGMQSGVSRMTAFLFSGTSMAVAGVRGDGGCERIAVSNWLWRGDDQIACPVFHPVDVAEAHATHREASR